MTGQKKYAQLDFNAGIYLVFRKDPPLNHQKDYPAIR